jgi:hypothetical protein
VSFRFTEVQLLKVNTLLPICFVSMLQPLDLFEPTPRVKQNAALLLLLLRCGIMLKSGRGLSRRVQY